MQRAANCGGLLTELPMSDMVGWRGEMATRRLVAAVRILVYLEECLALPWMDPAGPRTINAGLSCLCGVGTKNIIRPLLAF